MFILTRRLLLVNKSCALCLKEDKTDVFHITVNVTFFCAIFSRQFFLD